jgi:CheY-like chemotaxis protein
MQEPSILVIDDIEDIVSEMIAMFALVGVIAVGADSMEAGLACVRRHGGITLVLCDLHLRCENGRALPERLRETADLARRSLDIVFMTGEGAMDSRGRAGADAVILRKPIDPDVLIRLARGSHGVLPG